MPTILVRVLALASLSPLACMGGAPLSVGGDVAPASCPAPPPTVATDATDAAVELAPIPDAGMAPIARSVGLWMTDGFVRDMRAAGIGGRDQYGGDFQVADAFSGFVSYGMDIVALHQQGTLASTFDLTPIGGPTSLIIGAFHSGAADPIVPRTGYWLARLVYDGMTKAVETTKGEMTIRDSPGGRIHCELSQRGLRLFCAFRGVIRADFP